MDEVYHGHRITITLKDGCWRARISTVRGPVLPVAVSASTDEGAQTCLKRSRDAVEKYLRFLGGAGAAGDALSSPGAERPAPPRPRR